MRNPFKFGKEVTGYQFHDREAVARKPGTRRRNLELRGTSLWGWSNGLMLQLR